MKHWPADKVVRRSVAELEPYPKNARIHSEGQIAQIAKSIQQYGFTIPVLTDEQGRIIAGHGRVAAAKVLGLTEVPTMTAEDWSEAQRRAYTILDNKIALNASWDNAILGAEFTELEALGFDLGDLAFDPPEIALVRNTLAKGLVDPDTPAPAPPAEPVATTGDLWALGRHRLLCGDATKAEDAQKVLDAKPHLMVTDPPYGVDYDPSWRERYDQFKRYAVGKIDNDNRSDWTPAWDLFPGSIAYVWHGGLHSAVVQASLEAAKFKIRSQIIWAKQHFVFSRGDYHWQHEPCWYAVRDKSTWSGDRKQTTLWAILNHNTMGGNTTETSTGHGAQKPVECMRRPIENNSQPGDAVYDPFCGSGTTIIAAEMTARNCYAIEINPAYVDVAIIRWQTFTGLEAKLGEQTFHQVAEQRNRTDTWSQMWAKPFHKPEYI
jgi:DNA modification methylase